MRQADGGYRSVCSICCATHRVGAPRGGRFRWPPARQLARRRARRRRGALRPACGRGPAARLRRRTPGSAVAVPRCAVTQGPKGSRAVHRRHRARRELREPTISPGLRAAAQRVSGGPSGAREMEEQGEAVQACAHRHGAGLCCYTEGGRPQSGGAPAAVLLVGAGRQGWHRPPRLAAPQHACAFGTNGRDWLELGGARAARHPPPGWAWIAALGAGRGRGRAGCGVPSSAHVGGARAASGIAMHGVGAARRGRWPRAYCRGRRRRAAGPSRESKGVRVCEWGGGYALAARTLRMRPSQRGPAGLRVAAAAAAPVNAQISAGRAVRWGPGVGGLRTLGERPLQAAAPGAASAGHRTGNAGKQRLTASQRAGQ
jgi:hypothetical protein